LSERTGPWFGIDVHDADFAQWDEYLVQDMRELQ
jgi:hypothetical protein